MDFRRNWIVLALVAAVGVGGAVAGKERGRAGAAPARPAVGARVKAPNLTTASDPPFHWVQNLNGQSGAFDEANDVAFDNQGNVAVAGVLTGPNGRQRFAVARFSPQGTLLWARALTGANPDGDSAAVAVAVDGQGNIAAAGWLDKGGQTDFDFAVMKWKFNGDPLWTGPQTFDGGVNGWDAANDVAMDSVGNVVAAGFLQTGLSGLDTFDFVAMKFAGSDGVRTVFFNKSGSDTADNEAKSIAVDYDPVKVGAGVQEDFVAGGYIRDDNQQKFYVVKLNGAALSPGEVVRWEYAPTNNVEAEGAARAIAVDGNHDIVAGGHLDNGNGGTAYAVVKLAGQTGAPVWADAPPTPRGIATFYSGDGFGDYLRSLAIDGNGDIVSTGVAGAVEASGRLAVVKFLGATGATQFVRQLSGAAPDGENFGSAIAVLPNNFMVVAGALDDGGLESVGDFGVFVALKLDPGGNPIWKRTLNGDNDSYDRAYAVAVDGVGNIAAAGAVDNAAEGSQLTVAYVDQYAPAVRFLEATPNMLPPVGGEVKIVAEVEENIGVNFVTAEILYPGGSTEFVSLTREVSNNPNFPLEFWSATHQFPANASTATATYNITLLTGDINGNNGFGGAEQVQVQGDSVTPTISQCAVTPNYFGYQGGSTVIAATVTDNVGVASVEAKVVHPDGINATIVPLLLTTGDRYEGSFDVPANSISEPEFYSVDISAADAAGNSANTFCDTIQVDIFDGTAPVLSNCDVTPRNLPRTGGVVTLACEAQDNVEVSQVKAVITRPDAGTDVVVLTQTPDTSGYSGEYTVPANAVNAPQQYAVSFTAEDLQGNLDQEPCGDITIASADAEQPTIVQCSVNPNYFDHNGGAALIAADVTDNVGITRVEAKVLLPDGFTTIIVPLELVSGNRYEGTINTLGNSGTEPELYDVDLEAEDAAGNAATTFCDTILVDIEDVIPPSLSNCQVTPRDLPSSGGSVSLSATATDNRDLVLVRAMITRPGGGVDNVNLNQVAMSSTYNGAYQAPANPSNGPQQYQVAFMAQDAEGNVTQLSCGVFTVSSSDTDAPFIATCAVNPSVVSPSGGPVQITADVTDASGLAYVQARIVRPDGGVITVDMPPVTGDSFAGVFAAPANQSAQDAIYTVFIIARDTSGNTSVLRCGTVTVLSPDVAPPSLTGARVFPPYRSAAGGAFFIEAQATDNRGVAEVAARISGPGGFTAMLPLSLSGGLYKGTFNAPANSSGIDEPYVIDLDAKDTSNNLATASAGSATVLRPDSEPPVLVNCDVQRRAYLSAGGVVRFLAEATDNAGVDRVEVRITAPNASTSTVTLMRQSGNNFEGETTAPANSGASPASYAVEFVAIDTSGNVTTSDCGAYTVAPPDGSAPQIVSCQVLKRNFIAAGGATKIVATVTDDVAVATVQAVITRPDQSTFTLALEPQMDGSYAGVYAVSANTGSAPETHAVEIRARDTSDNLSTTSCGTITVAVKDAEPPVIANASATPQTLGGGGGTVTISADVTDNVSVTSVTAEVRRPDGSLLVVTLNPSGGSGYSGSFEIPANPEVTAQQYQIRLIAADPSSNEAQQSLGAVTVAGEDRTGPQITDCSATPAQLAFTGGQVTIQALVTDNVGVTGVSAVVTRGGALIARVPLTAGAASSFSGLFSAPANRANAAQTYEVQLEATDAAGNLSRVPCGSVQVGVDSAPPLILDCDASPRELPAEGGALQITATVTDAIPLAGVAALVTKPNGDVVRVSLLAAGADTFTGQYNVPANEDPNTQEYTIRVEATDIAGNAAVADCGSVSVAFPDGGQIDLSSSNVAFGRVRYGTRFKRELIIRNRSRTSRLAGTLSTLATPFSFRVEGAGGDAPSSVAGPGAAGGTVFSIGPGDTLIVTIDFAPRVVSAYRDRLQIDSSDPRRRRLQVRISGLGCRNGRRGTEIRD